MKWMGVVLAGGASRRMGQDKARLCLGGETLLERCRRQLLAVAGDCCVVSRDGAPGTVADRRGWAGPLAGIGGAVDALLDRCNALLVMPVDMPLVPDEALRQVQLQLTPTLAAIGYQDALFPLALRLDAGLSAALEQVQRAASGQASVQSLLLALEAVLLPVPLSWQSLFTNCNHPAQWQAIVDRVESDRNAL